MTNRELVAFEGGSSPAALLALYSYLQNPAYALTVMTAPGASPADLIARIMQPLDGVDFVIATSGSTGGTGHLVGLSLAALTASALATEARLGGPGQWLTSLPLHHIAGFQVARRAALASIPPVHYSGNPKDFAAAVASMQPDVRHYLSLVPTQLFQLLEAGAPELPQFDAVLVGGAALPAGLALRAREAGVNIVTSYGMTETAGGCVYDGVPLDGVSIKLTEGQVRIAGPILATRYLDTAAQPFEDGPVRWLQTADLGEWDGHRLTITGRADDVILSGGVNVAPSVVEQHLSALPGQWVVVGVADEKWGNLVVAICDRPFELAAARAATATLPPAFQPRAGVTLEIPHLASGKVDRRRARELATAAIAAGQAELRG